MHACPPVKTSFPPAGNVNETPGQHMEFNKFASVLMHLYRAAVNWYFRKLIKNGNRTLHHPTQSVIILVINKLRTPTSRLSDFFDHLYAYSPHSVLLPL